MKMILFRKSLFLTILTGFIFFSSGVGLIKAQTATTQPNFTIHLYAVEDVTENPIKNSTKAIDLGASILTDNNTYRDIIITLNSYTIYNKNSLGVWSTAVDQYTGPLAKWELGPTTKPFIFSNSLLCAVTPGVFGRYLPPWPTFLKNTSTQNGLVVVANLTVTYNSQNYNVNVSDIVYTPS